MICLSRLLCLCPTSNLLSPPTPNRMSNVYRTRTTHNSSRQHLSTMATKTRRLGDVSLVDCGATRQVCRSVSWNASGSSLAWASTDRTAKISTFENGASQGRELTTIVGHSAAVDRVRYHPKDPNWLCTAAQDRTIRLWDIRVSSNQRCVGKIDLQSSSKFGSLPLSVAWSPVPGNESTHLVVAERDNSVHVYDMRKPTGRGVGSGQPKVSSPMESFHLDPQRVEGCCFSPNGQHLCATTRKGESMEGMGAVRVWQWKNTKQQQQSSPKYHVYDGHAGPIYTHTFSPDGSRLATGGGDAIVGLWEVESMVCIKAITNRSKLIRSVAFSHDSKLLANCTEEDGIDLIDATKGETIGTVSLSPNGSGGGNFRVRGGADEIDFHPKGYHLACARGDLTGGNNSVAPVTLAKISVIS